MATRRTPGPARTTDTTPPGVEKAAMPRRRTASGQAAAAPAIATPRITVSLEARRAMIEQAAYLRAERRGFAPGGEDEDWLAAEAEVDALLKAGNGGTPQ